MGAVDAVDLVTSFDADTPVDLIAQVRPHVYAKGGDYTAQILPGTSVVERLGGEVHVLSYLSDHSTTAIVADPGGHRELRGTASEGHSRPRS